MLNFLIKSIWTMLPYIVRLKLIRITQRKFTASVVGIVLNEKREILVLDHLLRPGASWGLPGGFLDPSEIPEEAIKREMMEETGLKLQNVKLVRVRTVRQHIEIIFLAEGIGQATVKSREIVDLGWFAIDNFPENMSDPQQNLVREVLQEH